MAIRKIVIPYTNFLPNTTISAEHFNTNFDEIEYVFNQLYDDYIQLKSDTYSKSEVDNIVESSVSEQDKITNDKFDKLIEDLYLQDDLLYSSIFNISAQEIDEILHETTFGEYSTGFITDEQIEQILGGVFVG